MTSTCLVSYGCDVRPLQVKDLVEAAVPEVAPTETDPQSVVGVPPV